MCGGGKKAGLWLGCDVWVDGGLLRSVTSPAAQTLSLTALLSPPLGEVGCGSGRTGGGRTHGLTAKASPPPSPSRGRGRYHSYTGRAKSRSVRQSKATKSAEGG